MAPRSAPLSPSQASALARASLDNASELITDAQILVAAHRWPRAFALAVLAAEEVGKCRSCVVAASYFPDETEIWAGFWRDFRDHKPKFATWAGQLIDLQDWGPVGSSGDEAWETAWNSREALAKDVDSRKMAAFYVACDDGKVLAPKDQISEDETRGLITLVAGVVHRTKSQLSGRQSFAPSQELRDLFRRMRSASTGEEARAVALDLLPWLEPPPTG